MIEVNFNKDIKSVVKCKAIAESKPSVDSIKSFTLIQLAMVLHYLAPRFTAQEDCIQLLADAYGREQPWAVDGYYNRVRSQFSKQYLINKIEIAYNTDNRFSA